MNQSKDYLEKLQENLDELLEKDSSKEVIQKWVEKQQPADMAVVLQSYSKSEQKEIFSSIQDDEFRNEFLSFLEGRSLKNLVDELDSDEIAVVAGDLPPDEAVDLLEGQDDSRVEDILEKIDEETAEDIRSLRLYEEGTAGSLMTPDFLSVKSHSKVKDVINIIKDQASELESIDIGFVLTEAGKILGLFEVKNIFKQRENDFVLQYIDEDIITIEDQEEDETVFQVMSHHNLSILPVIDNVGRMKGIITADDVLDVAKDIMDEDFYHMVGTFGKPRDKNVFQRVWHRIPWLSCTLVGGMMNALVIKFFRIELDVYSVLLSFMTFVVGMSGNVGVQSATIIVREMVNKESTPQLLKKSVFREIATGLLNALVFGIASCILVCIVHAMVGWGAYGLGVAVGVALFCSMCVASLLGAYSPSIFEKFKIDPAIASGPIITTTADILGAGIYFFVAIYILRAFGIVELHF